MIHPGHPVGIHGGFLLFGVFSSIALDLDDEMQEIVLATAIIDENDKVRDVGARFGGGAVRHLETEIVVLDVRFNPRMGFGHAAKLRFPVAIEDDPVDVAAAGIRLVATGPGPGRGEIHVDRGADGIVRIEHSLDRSLVHVVRDDSSCDVLACLVGQLLIHELGGVGVALADKTAIEPLSGDALELSEKMEFRLLARIAPLCVEQPLGEMKEQSRAPEVAGVNQIEVDALADYALVAGDGRANDIGREFQRRVLVELGFKPLFRQFHPVPGHPWKTDLERISFGPHGPHLNGLSRRVWWGQRRASP